MLLRVRFASTCVNIHFQASKIQSSQYLYSRTMTFTLLQRFDIRLARAQCFDSGAVLWNLGEVKGARVGAILGTVGTVPPTCLMAFLVTMVVLLRCIDIGLMLPREEPPPCTSPDDSALTKLDLREA
ncbi:uncharacterized protein ARMOST_04023 [Armillaria ostoyae]|uniref:Uncharacterized protein n=1 Tax=Armillaria ostoyae TaxID=47428 RepID=A0A284QWA0_ARMOS|nr:uncharacterized protein ARMOST_04023 [Armillaria ostoyae]